MDSITITAAEHATYVAAMAEVETLRVKLATCREFIETILQPNEIGNYMALFQAAKEACK